MSKPLIEIENLKKYFPLGRSPLSKGGDRVVKAVDNVSFQIDEDKCFGLVSKSGSGKSTTGRCVPNLLCPTSGKVYFDGRLIFDEEKGIALGRKETMEYRKEMQIALQNPSADLDPCMTVGQIAEKGIKKHKITTSKEASDLVVYYLELCDLDCSMANRYPSQFSGGQKQRISIVRALVVKPRLVVADEPLPASDVSIQSQVLNLTSELKEKLGLTYLYISHNLKTVECFCNKVGVLYLGTLFKTGTIEETMIEFLHPYTKILFSTIPPEDPTAGDNLKRIELIGEIPSATNMPSGCKFHTRCPYVTDKHKSTEPQLACTGGIHFVACHHWQEINHKQSRRESRRIMGPRFKKIASTAICHSLRIQPGEEVMVSTVDDGDKLAEVLMEGAYACGAVPFISLEQTTTRCVILKGTTARQLELMTKPSVVPMGKVDYHVTISAPYNSYEFRLISQEKQTMYTKHCKNLISHAKSRLRWASLTYSSYGMAQNAGMSLSEFSDYYSDLMTMDCDKPEKVSLPMILRMRVVDQVHIVAPDMDLTVSLKGSTAFITASEYSLSDGETASTPDRCSANGTISFNVPSMHNSFLFTDVRLIFKDSRVVKASINDIERFLKEISLDEGCRYIDEFSMGISPYVQHAIHETLFDEKTGGPTHMALGACYNSPGRDNGNRSGIHWDLIQSYRPGHDGDKVQIDGELVHKNDVYLPEDLRVLSLDAYLAQDQ